MCCRHWAERHRVSSVGPKPEAWRTIRLPVLWSLWGWSLQAPARFRGAAGPPAAAWLAQSKPAGPWCRRSPVLRAGHGRASPAGRAADAHTGPLRLAAADEEVATAGHRANRLS